VPPNERSGPGGFATSPQSRSNATAGQTVTTDTIAPDAGLVAQAAALVDAIGDQAERDRQSYDAGWRDCVRLLVRPMFDHGVDVGREQVLNQIEAAEAETNRRLSERALDAKEHPFAELEARRYPGYTAERLRELRKRGAA
jgi:hypothetical protein